MALCWHGINQTISDMISIYKSVMYIQHFKLKLNQIVRTGYVAKCYHKGLQNRYEWLGLAVPLNILSCQFCV